MIPQNQLFAQKAQYLIFKTHFFQTGLTLDEKWSKKSLLNDQN